MKISVKSYETIELAKRGLEASMARISTKYPTTLMKGTSSVEKSTIFIEFDQFLITIFR